MKSRPKSVSVKPVVRIGPSSIDVVGLFEGVKVGCLLTLGLTEGNTVGDLVPTMGD